MVVVLLNACNRIDVSPSRTGCFFHWSGRRDKEGSRRVSVPQPVQSLFELEKWVS